MGDLCECGKAFVPMSVNSSSCGGAVLNSAKVENRSGLWDTAPMEQPELRITFKGPNGESLSGRCSVCNENIDRDQPPNTFETIEAAFKRHVEQKHSRA
jgi:hypothetical protein